MAQAERILIVGGGLAGLALALALREREVSADIIERTSNWGASGTGLYLIGAATRALSYLGLGDALARNGCVIRSQTVLNHHGTRVAQIDADAFWAPCGPCLALRRSDLRCLLAERVSGSHVRFGLTVQALQQHADRVAVQLSDGTTATYDLVVGADGIRSSVRRLAFGDGPPRFRGQVGWRFVTNRPPGIDGWTAYLGPGTAFLILPIGEDQVYCYADQAAAQPIDDPPERRIERLQNTFRHFASPVPKVLTQVRSAKEVHFSPIEEAVTQRYGQGRVALIGDAAHAMSPNMACGAAMAFEDGVVLADIIAHAREASEIAPELTRRRLARVRWVHAQTERRDRARKLPSVMRDAFLRMFWRRLYRANYQPLLAPP